MKMYFASMLRATLLSLAILPLSTSLAYASSQDIVLDKNGNPVLSSSGDCVRTKWNVGVDRCIGEQPVVSGVAAITEVIGIDERLVYFDFDSAKLSEEAKSKLNSLASLLKEHNIQGIKILGFTDRIGSDAYNYKLSKRRATAVKDYLDSKVKLNSSILVEKGFGKEYPIKLCETGKGKSLIECLAPNRRVVVEIDYSDLYESN